MSKTSDDFMRFQELERPDGWVPAFGGMVTYLNNEFISSEILKWPSVVFLYEKKSQWLISKIRYIVMFYDIKALFWVNNSARVMGPPIYKHGEYYYVECCFIQSDIDNLVDPHRYFLVNYLFNKHRGC